LLRSPALRLLALIGTVLGFIPAFVPIGAGVLLAAFLVTTMLTASKRDQAPVRKSARAYREFHEVESPREVVDYERPLTRAELQKAELDDFANWDPWDEEETPGWDAVPQTLPSYVNAPRATAVPRNIERNGDWSGESMVDMVAQSRAAQHNDLVREPVNNVSDATTEIPIIRANSSYPSARSKRLSTLRV